ncbi:bromodomain-containing protein [Babesia caballi]|uniref:Bromodomain-containing protein n=1 Tax=Babesia caballi TaxID=5871 RepID=A0AAV4LW39_BABCB|nr:bromodomain-containing protein [Babesia caballi]
MKNKKARDFSTKKARVGRQQFRKHASSDAKLLANVGQLKRTVKLATQSIVVNKDRLNVTSRRLTLAELIGKSRHTSEAVRLHALAGILEFTRRFADDARLNLFQIIQVAGAGVTSGDNGVRKQARALLLATLDLVGGVSGVNAAGARCAECLALYLVQGVLVSSSSIRTDVYGTIVGVLERSPSTLAEHMDQLLSKLVKNRPESPTAAHIDCLLAFFKIRQDYDRALCATLVDYLCTVVDYAVVEGAEVTTELGCLTIASMLIKSLKLILLNYSVVKPNDLRVLKALLCCDLHEYESLTERGKQTFEALFAEFVLLRAELGLKCASLFDRHQLVLLFPLVHLYCLRFSICADHESRIAAILLVAISVKEPHFTTQDLNELKPQWRQELLMKIPTEEVIFEPLRRALQNSLVSTNQHTTPFNTSSVSIADYGEHPGTFQLDVLFTQLCQGLSETIAQRPEILPIIAVTRGVAPCICAEMFCDTKAGSRIFAFLRQLPPDFEVTSRVALDHCGVLEHFIAAAEGKALIFQLLKTLLHMSRYCENIPELAFVARFLRPEAIGKLGDELRYVVRIALNCSSSTEVIDRLLQLFAARLCDASICSAASAMELMGALSHHLFAANQLDLEDGRAVGIDDHFQPFRQVLDKVASVADSLERTLDEDSVDLLEVVVGQCASKTMDRLLKSHSNNVWTVFEGYATLFKRCVQPVCERFVERGLSNMAVCVMNAALLPLHGMSGSDAKFAVDNNAVVSTANRPVWLQKLLEAQTVEGYSAVLLNRLPAGDGAEATVAKLCDTVSRILM